MRRSARALFFFALGLALSVPDARAQAEAALIYQGPELRALAIGPAGESLYLASYTSDEIIEIDPHSGAVRRRVTVAEGPCAIAVDSSAVAVLSRVGAEIAILSPADLSLRARVRVSPGTSILFGAGPGRVGAISPFSGEVALIDLDTGATLSSVALSGGVPVSATFDGDRIAVVGRSNSQVWILHRDSLETIAVKHLSVAPRAIVSTAPGVFVIEADNGLLLFESATLDAFQVLNFPAGSLDAVEDKLFCVSAGQLHAFTSDLRPQASSPIPAAAQSARWVGPSLISWSRALGRVWRADATTAPVLAGSSASALEFPGPPQALAVLAQDPPGEPTPTAREPAPADTAATDAVPEPEYRFTIRPSPLRLGGFRPYAPHFGDPTGRTISEALDRALHTGAEDDSLLSATIPERIENLRFGGRLRSVAADGGTRVEADGGVELELGDVHVSAQRLSLQSDPRGLRLEGDPSFTRGDSSLSAGRVYAFDSRQPLIPGLWPLVPSEGGKTIPHPLVPHGHREPSPAARPPLGTIQFDHIEWSETDRRLKADALEVNTLTRHADLENAEGQLGPLFFGADSLRVLGPRTVQGEDFWMTTCDDPDPHYRFRISRAESNAAGELVVTHARLQLRRVATPLYVPRYTVSLAPGERQVGTEIKLGGSSTLGSYLNVAQWFRVNDGIEVAPRVYATSKNGIGLGFDSEYDYMKDPSAAFFRSKGRLRTLYTTDQDGFTEWYHRQELTPDTVLVGQWEQWYRADVIKDFYPNEYENRTGPRSFLSVAHTRPEYLVTGTLAPSTHGFTEETEKLPELTLHLFERSLGQGFYGTFDAVAGYYETQPETIGAGRAATLARLSYDWNLARGFNVLPFVELDGTYYTETLDESGDAFRGTATAGLTVQSRVQRSFRGLGKFTGFKHIVIPSVTLSYRPDATLDAAEVPQFDALDKRPGRLRVESTLDNILLGRNSVNDQVWPVARLTFYQGFDLENEAIKANDYEVDVEVRPRPAWGARAVAEIHDVSNSSVLPGDDFNRLITYAFYDNLLHKNTLNGRVGFAFTEAGQGVANQEVLYGIGYKIAKRWSVAFEQRYDFERQEFTRQTYTIRRKLHDWELGLMLRDRQDSFDIGFHINLIDFPAIGTGF